MAVVSSELASLQPISGRDISSSLMMYWVWKKKGGFNLNTDKYNWEEHRDHFILADAEGDVDFGEGKKNIFALPETQILIQNDHEVQMAVKPLEKAAVFTSADFHTASETAVCSTVRFSGLHLQRTN